jgi:hypothetical protein
VALAHPNAGAIRSLLFGRGHDAIQGLKYITETGARKLPGPPPVGVLNRLKHIAADTMVGSHGLKQIEQRATQGGLLGRGGIVHGALALPHDLATAISQKGVWGGIKDKPIEAVSAATNAGFLAGLPAYAVYKGNERGEGIGHPLGEGLGWTVAAPFGLAGVPIARMAGMVGNTMLPGPVPPPIQSYTGGDMTGAANPQDYYPQEKVGALAQSILPRIKHH